MALLPGGSAKANHAGKSNFLIFAAIAGWYLASSLSNNTNKQILNVFPRPMVLSVVQLGCIAVYSTLYLLYQGKMKVISVRQLIWFVLPLSISNFCSHVFTYTSLKEVPVSFVHTVKVWPSAVIMSLNLPPPWLSRTLPGTLALLPPGITHSARRCSALTRELEFSMVARGSRETGNVSSLYSSCVISGPGQNVQLEDAALSATRRHWSDNLHFQRSLRHNTGDRHCLCINDDLRPAECV